MKKINFLSLLYFFAFSLLCVINYLRAQEGTLVDYATLFNKNFPLPDSTRRNLFLQLANEYPKSGPYGIFAKIWLTWKDGNNNEALSQVELFIKDYPQFAYGYGLRAAIHMTLGKPEEVILADVDRALNLEPTWGYAHLIKARYYNKQQQYEKALAELEVAMAKDTSLWQKIKALEFQILKKQRKAEQAFALAKSILQKHSTFAPAFAWISELAIESGKNDTALFYIQHALRYAPQNYDFLLLKLKIQLARKQYSAAEKLGDTLVAQKPNVFHGFFWRGKARYTQRSYSLALQDFNQALELAPNDTAILMARAQTHYSLNDPQNAIEDFSKILFIDPLHYDARRFRATLRMNIGENENALQDFNFLIEKHPKVPSLYSDRGVIRRRLGDIEGALQDYGKALELNPQDFAVYNNRAYLLTQLNRNAEAIADYNKALEIKPDFVFALNNRGQLKQKIGDWNGAIRDFSEAIKKDPRNAQAYFLRGQCKMQIYDTSGACKDWKSAAKYGHLEARTLYSEKCLK
ncbi:MAG: tetratricopeptide repeat protein [Bacteroidia bacterium]|nr:tetratricopeptide repeat protein [Bacteroidia bacterium]MDW8159257.1 tetratricopeptide repeat protein [Bacteroidia bacterium]